MSRIRFVLLKVSCRDCGEEIPVEVEEGDSASLQAKIDEIDRKASEAHRCKNPPDEPERA